MYNNKAIPSPELQSFWSAARIALAGSRISRKRSSFTLSYRHFTCPRLHRKPEVYDLRLPASGQPELLIHGAGQKDRGNSQDGNYNKRVSQSSVASENSRHSSRFGKRAQKSHTNET